MAITTRDGLIAAIAASRCVQFQKPSFSTTAGGIYTHFRNPGLPTTGGSAPASTGVALSRSSAGAMPIPGPDDTSYITSFEAIIGTAQCLMLADRLVEFGGLVANSTSTQTVSALALPSRASAETDVELWLEVYTAGGATASASVTASYTNQDGTASRTATLMGGTPTNGLTTVHRSYQFSLQAGDTGVQSVQSLTFGTSSGTAGNVGLVLRRTLLTGSTVAANSGFVQGWAETDLQLCPDDACLELMSLASSTLTGLVMGNLAISQG
jgi:hypothetical protein